MNYEKETIVLKCLTNQFGHSVEHHQDSNILKHKTSAVPCVGQHTIFQTQSSSQEHIDAQLENKHREKDDDGRYAECIFRTRDIMQQNWPNGNDMIIVAPPEGIDTNWTENDDTMTLFSNINSIHRERQIDDFDFEDCFMLKKSNPINDIFDESDMMTPTLKHATPLSYEYLS